MNIYIYHFSLLNSKQYNIYYIYKYTTFNNNIIINNLY